MVKSLIAPLIVGGALAAAPLAPALAQSPAPVASVHVEVGASPAHYRGRGYRGGPNINRREAVRIASSYGLARVRDVELRRGVWEIDGISRRGARIEVEINARTGRVLDVDYGRDRRRGYRGNDRRYW